LYSNQALGDGLESRGAGREVKVGPTPAVNTVENER